VKSFTERNVTRISRFHVIFYRIMRVGVFVLGSPFLKKNEKGCKALHDAGCHLSSAVICLIQEPEVDPLNSSVSNPGGVPYTRLNRPSQVTLNKSGATAPTFTGLHVSPVFHVLTFPEFLGA
jgi:hypothetical protein